VDELLSEKEQVEQLRNWWKENGTYVIVGIVLGVGGIFGFNAWKSSKVELRVEASTMFENLADEVSDNRLESAEAIASDIYNEYGTTIYSDQARLAMARLYMDQGRDQDAAETLEALVNGGNNDELKRVARLRLAKVYLYQGKPDEVLTLLSGFEDSGFAARYSEAIGDAQFALGNFDAAEAAWRKALEQDASAQLVDTGLLQMKINDLPVILPEGDVAPVETIEEPAGTEAGEDVPGGEAAAGDGAETEADAGGSAEAEANAGDSAETGTGEDPVE
jgi:predicted negative regulator of RcsB-dependent stress response